MLGRCATFIESFAAGALRRGSRVEQFLGATDGSPVAGIRWVEVVPRGEGFAVVLHEAEDIGGERFADLAAFPDFPGPDGEERFGTEVGVAVEGLEALTVAEETTGAVRHRWVNSGVAQDEYLDFVRAGRPANWPVDA